MPLTELGTYNPNIIECDNVEKANMVNMTIYRLSERMSANFGKYIFIKRQRK